MKIAGRSDEGHQVVCRNCMYLAEQEHRALNHRVVIVRTDFCDEL